MPISRSAVLLGSLLVVCFVQGLRAQPLKQADIDKIEAMSARSTGKAEHVSVY
jgi:hypothetical protein